ncbi:predicted protein [Nematostella vectensis]|uniref:Channel forming colicins domain-containing protein n=1 Tax=Nematostella vectensis TaxID=45351 RepID=A7SYD5_NEMVE|nr:uncharacterized protein LOC5502176 [Nematostella vectensis]EDO31291.1 predicted protein [Nematostella vectensis]|eukprot:XP_001623391.1 predicted protein [Nematostella vectensis]
MPFAKRTRKKKTNPKEKVTPKRTFWRYVVEVVSPRGRKSKSRDMKRNIISPRDISITLETEEDSCKTSDQIEAELFHPNSVSTRRSGVGFLESVWTLNGDETDWKTLRNSTSSDLHKTPITTTHVYASKNRTRKNSKTDAKPCELVSEESFEWAKDVRFGNGGNTLEMSMGKLSIIGDQTVHSAKGNELKSLRKTHLIKQRRKLLFKPISPVQGTSEEKPTHNHAVSDQNNGTNCSTSHTPLRKSLTFSANENKSRNHFSILSFKRRKSSKKRDSARDCTDQDGTAALLRAAKNNSSAQASFLINHGLSTEVVDTRGWSPLFIALENDNFECADVLVNLRANVNFKNEHFKHKTILHELSRLGKYKAVEFLLSRGANPSAPDDSGWPPFHYALMAKCLKCAALLISFGADARTYTLKRVEEYEDCMRLVAQGKWQYKWKETLDIDIESTTVL